MVGLFSVSKTEAWQGFLDLNENRLLHQQLKTTVDSLTNSSKQLDEDLVKLKAVITKLIQFLDDFDKIEEERIVKNLLNFTGNTNEKENNILLDIRVNSFI